MWRYDSIDWRIESKSISPETTRRDSRKKLGSCELNCSITNDNTGFILLDKPTEKLSLGIYEKQYANKDDLGVSRIALDLRGSTANLTSMLEQLEFKVIDLALERLKQKPVILIDIFEHEKGGLPKLSSTHTVCLWKQQDDKLLIIDPSSAAFSSFLKNLIEKTHKNLEINIYNDGKKFYQSDLLGPLKYELSRDCVDIAVKIGLQIQEDLGNNVKIKTVESNISNLSNQTVLNKTVKELGNDGIIVRALQSTDSKVREDTRDFLKNNAPILKYVKFSTIKQAKNFVEQLQFSTFSIEVKEKLKDLEDPICIERETIRTSFALVAKMLYKGKGRIFDDDTHDKMLLENHKRCKDIMESKQKVIYAELERIKASTTEKDYIQLFRDIDKELKETAMRFSNIDEFLSFSNLCRQIKEIQGKIDDNSAFSRIDIPILKKLPKKTLNKDQQKFLDEVLENKIYLDSENCTELYVATKNNDTDSVNKILAKWNEDYKSIAKNLVALCDIYGQTALHWAAGKGYKGICEVLVDNMGLDDIVTKAAGRHDYTALHMAVHANNLDIVELILQKNKDIINLTDEYGQTALHWAAGKGYNDICKILVDNMDIKTIGSKTKTGQTLFHLAVSNNDINLLNYLLEEEKTKEFLNEADQHGRTPLYYACLERRIDICNELIEHIAPGGLITQDRNGNTPLHAICNSFSKCNMSDVSAMIEKLIEKNAAIVNITNRFKQTPLHFAVLKEELDICKTLLKYIDRELVTQGDINGYDVVRLASEKHFHAGLKLLTSYVNKDSLNKSESPREDRVDENNDEASVALLSNINKGTIDDAEIDITLVSADSDDPDSTGVMGDTST